MEARNTNFFEIMSAPKQFIIPVFQRDYTWGTANWDRLLNDITNPIATDHGHFVGSVVHVAESTSASLPSYLIIDGQQRLTTLSVLCAAIRDHVQEHGWETAEDYPSSSQLDTYFMKNPSETGRLSYKLTLRRADDEILKAVVDGQISGSNPHLIARAYYHFKRALARPEANLPRIYQGVRRLRMVELSLNRGIDEPQAIFESMNSTGQTLRQSDLVRNYLLMGLAASDQERLYNDYWHKVETLFRGQGDPFNAFLRDYIALKRGATRQLKDADIYEEFKKLEGASLEDDREVLLADMLRFAGFYANFIRPATESAQLNGAMLNVRRHSDTPALLIMRLYDCHEKGFLSERDFIRALTLIESYLIRHMVAGRQIRSYWHIFAVMAREIVEQSPWDSFVATLSRWRGQNGFWTFLPDDSFAYVLQHGNLYFLKICKYLLERMENYGQVEISPTARLTVEHVMPQQPGAEWRQMLGDDWERAHSEWLHRLGNLTLTGYNQAMSNRPFHEKKTIPGGFNQSAVRLNQYVREQEVWTEAQMAERGRILAERALQIWPYPRV